MTINEMIDGGVTFQGARIVSAAQGVAGGYAEVVLYDGSDEWSWACLDDDWAGWDVNYIWADREGRLVVELDNPNC